MNNEEFDKIMTEPYSKEGWVVMPTKPLPENEEIEIGNLLIPENGDMDVFLEKFRQSWLELPGIPICAVCYSGLELNKKGNICCPHCKWEIIVEKE